MENTRTIDGRLLARMLMNGFANLSHNKNYLNEMNVFPVSDNDTGSNMKNTYARGVDVLKDDLSFHKVIYAFVTGMLIGSRGNSGFILSQYFLGIYEYTRDKELVTISDLIGALQHASQVAYRAVHKPANGSMLTVMRDSIDRSLAKIDKGMSVIDFFDALVEEMFFCTQETINQLDVLRENNVVDSGALGLYLIFDGMRRSLHDNLQHFDCEGSDVLPRRVSDLVKSVSFFRYCTEFVMKLPEAGAKTGAETGTEVQSNPENKDRGRDICRSGEWGRDKDSVGPIERDKDKSEDRNKDSARPGYWRKDKDFFLKLVEGQGDSIVVALNEGILKVHLHTNRPDKIMEEFSKHGDIATKKVDDLFLTEEFERLKKRKHKGFAVLAFADTQGNAMTLEQFGADVALHVPSAYLPEEDELKMLMESFKDENLILFPNNKDTQNKFKNIKWHCNMQKLYVVESDNLVKNFFILSSIIFSDSFVDITKFLDRIRGQRLFQTTISVSGSGENLQYSSQLKNKVLAKKDISTILNLVAGEAALEDFSIVLVFGGRESSLEDINSLRVHFEDNILLDLNYFADQHEGANFIIGAY